MDNIYFDLDGTLTDPKPGITRSIQYALKKLDREVPSEDELTWCIGPPCGQASPRCSATTAWPIAALALYRERFADVGLYENAVYPDIEHVLTELARPGRRLFVATSKPAVYAKRIVEHFNLARHFETVFGSELDGTRVHKDELLAYAIDDCPHRSRAVDHDRRPQPRYRGREEERDERDRRRLWLWQPRGTDRGRRQPCLRHAPRHSRSYQRVRRLRRSDPSNFEKSR